MLAHNFYLPRILSGLLLFGMAFGLFSFEWVSVPPNQQKVPTNLRRLHRLEQRLSRTRSLAQQKRLRYKIKHLRQAEQATASKNWTWSTLGFVLTLLGIITSFLPILRVVTILFNSVFIPLLGLGIAISLAAFILALNDDRFGGKGLALAGLILGTVMLLGVALFPFF